MSKIVVERLTIDNLYWFAETAAVRMLVEEAKRPELINMDQMYALCAKGIEDGTGFVAKKDDKCIGALGAILTPNLFNPNIKTLAEIFWWVDPEYRNTRAGALLLMKFEERAGEIADEATLSLLGSSTVNMQTLEKRGFYMEEFAFRKVTRRE